MNEEVGARETMHGAVEFIDNVNQLAPRMKNIICQIIL